VLPHSIATLWQATFKKLEERCPLALRVLESLTFCEPEGIPYELLEGLFNEFDPSATSELRQILIDYELLQEREMQQDGEVYKHLSMHRLLQQVVQQAAGKEYLNSYESTSILGQKSLNPLLQVLHKCIPNVKPVPDKNWEQARLYVPHVVSFLAKTGKNLEKSILLAELLDCMGSYSEKVQCNYPQALKYYEQALAINRIFYIGNHPAIAASLNNLASAHRGLGKH
ncbi:tetratricopeptide repeat protein, partial [Rhizobium leguminosarum]|nr:tetratricopeptide repeat protein [Rhizobium leguminosarum]